MRKLLNIWLVISLINCTQANHSITSEPIRYQPASVPVALGNFTVIDPDDPPLQGLYLSWGDAQIFSTRLEYERINWQKLLYRQYRDYELERLRREMLEKEYQNINSSAMRFWQKWGFVLGIGAGLVLGVTTSVVVATTLQR